eukprot:CAMPEP_0180265156 /NCGR_PEP_ID=MMETSP0988-20121125/282_1 /TAXON_ID=697907 /ORGANISM="non described non described, Strain CCMP2293" /LENGTH=139 /DNA_ID=CAMNT_0022235583 /DNA_START=29 /DNA_END=444 /DNA_ORIENTATION=+
MAGKITGMLRGPRSVLSTDSSDTREAEPQSPVGWYGSESELLSQLPALEQPSWGGKEFWGLPEYGIDPSFVVGNAIILFLLAALLVVRGLCGAQGLFTSPRKPSARAALYVPGQPSAPVKSALRHLAADEGEAFAVGKG